VEREIFVRTVFEPLAKIKTPSLLFTLHKEKIPFSTEAAY
jgi:hypothetical protein